MPLALLSKTLRLGLAAGVAAAITAGGAAYAQSNATPNALTLETAKPRPGVVWTATTKPAPMGSKLKLEIKNGATAQTVGVGTAVAAKGTGKPAPNKQQLQLAAGETKIIEISNDLADGARFRIHLLSQNSDLHLQITVTDSTGKVIETIGMDGFRHAERGTQPGKKNPGAPRPGAPRTP